MNKRKESEARRLRRAFENLNYIIMIGLICGQVLVGKNYMLGQGCYLVANIIASYRTFSLNRPMSDKIKDVLFTGLTLALMLTKGGLF